MNEMFNVPSNVVYNVERYFEVNLPQYTVEKVMKKSNHPNDWYLYMVIGRKKEDPYNMGRYTLWTSWNETTNSLNLGHYGIDTEEEVMKLAREHYSCH